MRVVEVEKRKKEGTKTSSRRSTKKVGEKKTKSQTGSTKTREEN